MAGTILLTYTDDQLRRDLQAWLAGAGFEVQAVNTLQGAIAELRHSPALTLLDLELSQVDQVGFSQFGEHCQLSDIPCLCYSANGHFHASEPVDLAPWSERNIFDPRNRAEVLQQVATELKLKELVRQQVLIAGRLQEKQLALEEGLRSAEMIQNSLLPGFLPSCQQYRFAWRFLPCDQVGGDLLNLIQVDEKTIMVYLLDVSGHGVSSAMVTVSVYQSLSLHTGRIIKQLSDTPPYYRIPSPAEVLAELEKEYPYERFEKFFTISYLLLEVETGVARFSNGGHPPPVLVRADGSLELLNEGGSLIGMGGQIPFEEGKVTLATGDRIYLYSDGITEYAGPDNAMFGEPRFFQLLRENCAVELDNSCSQVISNLQAFGQGIKVADDISLLGVEYCGQGGC
jgi:phosphoserine phosphatase RsbU/P